jgi:DNA-binding Lrp family transcriptional regulator
MNELKLKILDLLKEDARRDAELIATLLGITRATVEAAIAELEKENVIVKYATIINWSKVDEDKVTALIEVQITPERGRGFDAIADLFVSRSEIRLFDVRRI